MNAPFKLKGHTLPGPNQAAPLKVNPIYDQTFYDPKTQLELYKRGVHVGKWDNDKEEIKTKKEKKKPKYTYHSYSGKA